MRQDGGLLLSVAYLWPHFVKVSVFNSGGVPPPMMGVKSGGVPPPIVSGISWYDHMPSSLIVSMKPGKSSSYMKSPSSSKHAACLTDPSQPADNQYRKVSMKYEGQPWGMRAGTSLDE